MMNEDEIITKAIDKSFDGFTCTTSKSMARDILAALTANGMMVVCIEPTEDQLEFIRVFLAEHSPINFTGLRKAIREMIAKKG